MRKRECFHKRVQSPLGPLLLILLLLGCKDATSKTAQESRHAFPWPAPGAMISFPPIPLTSRLIDLATFPSGSASGRIQTSGDEYPNGSKYLPWGLANPAIPTGAFDPAHTPYWCAKAPAWVTVDLGRVCYVSQVIVQPLSERYGVSAFSVRLTSSDGKELAADPSAQASREQQTQPGADRPGIPLVASFHPRRAQGVRISFTSFGPPDEQKIYIRTIRVLGQELDVNTLMTPAPPEDTVRRLIDSRENVAAFSPETVKDRVRVSEDRAPNGRLDVPWIDPGPQAVANGSAPSYWCASQPAWVEVDLKRPCYINEVSVQPFSEAFGVSEFYLKVVDENGGEFDTSPPCEVTGAAPIAPPNGSRPAPFVQTFDPALARKLKFYFVRGSQNGLVYVAGIKVLGVPG